MTIWLHRIIFAMLLATLLVTSPSGVRGEQFRVALSTKDFGYLPLFVGIRAGLFAQENLEIQWIVVNSNVVVTALLAGEIDIAGLSMRAAARGALFSDNLHSEEGQKIIVTTNRMLAHPKVKSPESQLLECQDVRMPDIFDIGRKYQAIGNRYREIFPGAR